MGLSTAAVLGGFFPANGVNSLVGVSGEDGQRRQVRQMFDSRGLLDQRQLLIALVGAVAGGTATKTIARIQAAVELGGLRTIEVINLINRATTAQDVTDLNNAFLKMTTLTTFGANPPPNLDRNPLGTR